MIFDKDGTTTIIFQENIALQEFLKNLSKGYPNVKNDNIIVNLFSFSDLTAGDILEFLQISNAHRGLKKSFVLVTDKVSFEEVPEEICVVPTICRS